MEASASDRVDELSRLVTELASRVSALERLAGLVSVAPDAAPIPAAPIAEPAGPAMLPVLGRCLLGLAGAYLLRALTSAGTVPAWVGVTIGILYAIAWMASSVRFSDEDRLTAGFHITTAVLALAPMLWETTAVFHAIHAWAAAALLTGFSVLGLELAWKRNLAIVAWVTTLAGVVTAVALLIATEDLVPFTLTLIVLSVAVEFSACRDHWLGERWLVALAADLAVFALVRLVTRPAGLPQGYASIAPALVYALPGVLLLVYLGSTVVRTLLRGLDICVFELAQLIAVFALFVTAAEWGSRGAPLAAWAIGAFAFTLGAGCYLVSFTFLRPEAGRDRNLYAYTTLGLALVVLGTFFLLPGDWRVASWCGFGLAGAWLARRSRRHTLRLHSLAFLLLAAVESGLTGVVLIVLRSDLPAPGSWNGIALVSLVIVAIGYNLLASEAEAGHKVPAALAAGLVLWSASVLAASHLRYLLPHTIHPAWGSMILTTLLVAAAAASAWTGRRFLRQELTWLLYPTMIAAAYRLLAHDFRSGRPETLCVELLFFGGALIVVPKLLRESTPPANCDQTQLQANNF